jgi:hypothetical protein
MRDFAHQANLFLMMNIYFLRSDLFKYFQVKQLIFLI